MGEGVHLQRSEDYVAVVRHIHLTSRFDRLGLALITGVPFGTVSRIISELDNDGYIKAISTPKGRFRLTYHRADTVPYKIFEITTRNGTKHNWNFGGCAKSTSTLYQKTKLWSQFMRALDLYIRKPSMLRKITHELKKVRKSA